MDSNLEISNTKELEYDGVVFTDKRSKSNIPKPVLNQFGYVYQDMNIRFKNKNESFTNLFEDTIIDYKEGIGKQKFWTHKDTKTTYMYKYLETYVSVGIPTELYNCVLRDVSNCFPHVQIVGACESIHDGYTWVIADIDPNVQCSIYLPFVEDTCCMGPLCKIMTQIKSSVSGYGRFKVQIMSWHGYFLKFTLTDFQLVDKASITMYMPEKSYVEVDISESLKRALKINDHTKLADEKQ